MCTEKSRQLCDDIECKVCYEKSFQSCEKSKYWSAENKDSPREILKFSHKKFKFNCPDCNDIYISSLGSISASNTWCGCTLNKTETKLHNYLKLTYNTQIEKQKKFEFCKKINLLPFDYYLPEKNIIIELDGKQHFYPVWNWNSPEKTQENDKYKMKCANEQGYSVIRLLQDDVFFDKNNWKNKLDNAIKIYDDPQNIFLADIYTANGYK